MACLDVESTFIFTTELTKDFERVCEKRHAMFSLSRALMQSEARKASDSDMYFK